MRRAAPLSLAVSLATIVACETSTPAPRRAEIPPGCWLESAVATYGDATVRPNCGVDIGEGVCGEDCQKVVRDCVLSSTRQRKVFSVAWTNRLIDGIGTRRAVVGRNGDAGYEVTWLDYELVNGFDPTQGSIGKKRVRVTARFCHDLDDLREVCDPRLSAAAASCAKSGRRLSDDAWLHCEGDETPFCAE